MGESSRGRSGSGKRLRAVERRAVDGERARLEELIAARTTLEKCDKRLQCVLATASRPTGS